MQLFLNSRKVCLIGCACWSLEVILFESCNNCSRKMLVRQRLFLEGFFFFHNCESSDQNFFFSFFLHIDLDGQMFEGQDTDTVIPVWFCAAHTNTKYTVYWSATTFKPPAWNRPFNATQRLHQGIDPAALGRFCSIWHWDIGNASFGPGGILNRIQICGGWRLGQCPGLFVKHYLSNLIGGVFLHGAGCVSTVCTVCVFLAYNNI